MEDMVTYGIIVALILAISALGIKVTIHFTGGTTNKIDNSTFEGDYTGRDSGKKESDERDKE